MAPPAQTPSGTMSAIIVSIKIAAIAIAVGVTILLIYGYDFRWYAALAVGVVAYVAAKPVLAIGVGYLWGQQDARETKQYIATLPPEVKQDLIDNAPSDVKERVADVILKSDRPRRAP
jgi:hypothetical protein